MKLNTKICTKCGMEKPHEEFYIDNRCKSGRNSRCKECVKKYRQEHQKQIKRAQKTHYQKHKEKVIKKSTTYYKKHKRKIAESAKKYRKDHINEIRAKRGQSSMYKNKKCASYLGIVVGERLCKHIFKDVKIMPNGHPGYDIICNKGKKIDVKTACKIKTRWVFHINKNSKADYFVCIAFDNRIDLNPLYIWMIPGNDVKNAVSISISVSTIKKWDNWKQNIKDIATCCTTIKNKECK